MFPLDFTLIVLSLLIVSCLPHSLNDFLIICSSLLLLPCILFTVYFLLPLPLPFLHIISNLSFHFFNLLCVMPPPIVPGLHVCCISWHFIMVIGWEVLVEKHFVEDSSGPVPWPSMVRRGIK